MRDPPVKEFWVYIMTNEPRGVLYVGVTSDLAGRAWQHREGVIKGFTRRYGLRRLVYFERQNDASTAMQRECAMKRWRRDWKLELIEQHNPTWRDLFGDVVREAGFDQLRTT